MKSARRSDGVAAIAAACAVLVAAAACSEREGSSASSKDGGERDADARAGQLRPDAGRACEGSAQVEPIRELDLLFVIDTSITMAQEQSWLAEQVPALLQRLAPDESGRTLHLGVVSGDLGADPSLSDLDEGRCELPGDDGRLQRDGNTTLEGASVTCSEQPTPFLTHQAGRDAIASTASDLACLVRRGTGGCGHEQQLESALRAVWPGAGEREPIGGPAAGQGDGENAGFLEPESDALLAVIALSDEDDCSHPDAHFLWPSSRLDRDDPADARLLTQGLRARCALNPDALYPLERYLDGWRALRGGRAERVFFAALVGAPPDAVGPEVLAGTDFDDAADRERFYDELLAHPQMQIAVDERGTDDPSDDAIRPSCFTDSGTSSPPARFTELARAFGGYGLVQSLCGDDYAAAVEAIAARIDQLMAAPGCR